MYNIKMTKSVTIMKESVATRRASLKWNLKKHTNINYAASLLTKCKPKRAIREA